jgi:hypothetical protein
VRTGSDSRIRDRARRRSASKHTEAYLLIDGYPIAYGCESIDERLRRAPDDERSLDSSLVEAGGSHLVALLR